MSIDIKLSISLNVELLALADASQFHSVDRS